MTPRQNLQPAPARHGPTKTRSWLPPDAPLKMPQQVVELRGRRFSPLLLLRAMLPRRDA